ncbi:MAG: PQQ-binding-like beta-propeller repeat protein, partial [Planctomycetales bacterium]|nr:PQQ-binding-like beta-propeller repeat protein [Planctomycetales bacterium]
PHVVFVTRLHCVGVEPETGKEVFRFRFGQTGPTVNAATPLAFDKHLFLSASYGIGASMYQVGGGKLSPLWSNDNSMSSQYTTCVQRDGVLFGIHGREDAGSASLRSVDAKTGKVLWEQDSAVGHLLLAKNYLIVLEVDGRLRLVEPDKHQYREAATHNLGDGTWRAIPALSDGRLFVRDSNEGQIRCLSVSR